MNANAIEKKPSWDGANFRVCFSNRNPIQYSLYSLYHIYWEVCVGGASNAPFYLFGSVNERTGENREGKPAVLNESSKGPIIRMSLLFFIRYFLVQGVSEHLVYLRVLNF